MSMPQKMLSSEDLPGHYISPDQLCVGLYVHLDLGWMQHPFVFRNFKIKNEEQIDRVRALNLRQIRYDPLRSDVVPGASESEAIAQMQIGQVAPVAPVESAAMQVLTSSEKAMQQALRLKQLNEAILHADQEFSRNAIKVRGVIRDLSEYPESAKAMAETMVTDMVNSVMTESDVALHAISSHGRNEEPFVHSLNVTVLALMLAKSLDMKDEHIQMLGMAALFHDAGKEESPRKKSFLDLHCETGYSITQRSGFPERVSEIILQHHECMDGSGFPKRLRADAIDPLARLVAMVNHYDNLCNPRQFSEALTPYEALSKMYGSYPEKFDPRMLKMLVKLLGVYPPGSIVQLSNGLYGMVITSNHDQPLLPYVMVYLPKVARETPVVINLGESNNLKIRNSLQASQLPREVFDYLGPRKRISYYFLKKEAAQDLQVRPESPIVKGTDQLACSAAA